MPFIRFTRPTLVGTSVLLRGAIREFDNRQCDHYVKGGAGEIVPPGTPERIEHAHETTRSERRPETAVARPR